MTVFQLYLNDRTEINRVCVEVERKPKIAVEIKRNFTPRSQKNKNRVNEVSGYSANAGRGAIVTKNKVFNYSEGSNPSSGANPRNRQAGLVDRSTPEYLKLLKIW